jgi:hypothetical protein
MDNFNSFLLSKSEINYILNSIVLSKSYEYKRKSTIKKKINKFVTFELPLLIKTGLLDKQLIQSIMKDDVINNSDMLPELGKEKVAGSNPAQGFSFEHKVGYLMRKKDGLRYCI